MAPTRYPPLTASMLRHELSARSRVLAATQNLLHELTPGRSPCVIFGQDEQGRHGNFHPESFRCLTGRAAWAQRRTKVHTAYRKLRARADWDWRELDSATSSDALLMNIFCHPEVFASGRVQALLGIEAGPDNVPEFGYRVGVPFASGKKDRTEIDMRLGGLLVEAKLTESGFQEARLNLIERYRDLDAVFEIERLPLLNGRVRGYQLIRGALAAYATGSSFCVLSDARRVDLIDAWSEVQRAVRLGDLRWRLKMLTWQELAAALPPDLQDFLAVKYGIVAQ